MADDGISGAELAGAASGAGGALSSLISKGQNKRLATGFYGQPGYDKNAPLFGGSNHGLIDYTKGLNQQQLLVEGRGANLADYGHANTWEQRGVGDRAQQLQLAAAQKARALGQVPSIAQMQADRQMQQAQAAQGAQQASARGAAGLALAGQVAAGNTANAQSSIAGQAQVNAANERMQAEGAAQNAYGNIRQGDQTGQQIATQQAQFQAGQQQANRDANDTRAMQNQQLGLQARLGEMNARTSNQGALAGSYTNAELANQRTADTNAQGKGLIDNVKDFFSDERTKIPLLSTGFGGVINTGNPDAPPQASSGPAAVSYEKYRFDSKGRMGEDVAASGKAMSDFATKYQTDPVAPVIVSDERSKNQFPIMPMLLGAGAGALAGPALGVGALGGAGLGAGALGIASLLSDERTKTPLLARGRSYDTALSPAEEKDFQEWKKKYAPKDSGADYDLRGAFRAGLKPDGKTGHWEDTFKKPNHPTFSNQSQYADDAPSRAGAWNGEKYIPPSKLGMSRGGRGPRGEGVGDPNAPRVTFDPIHGWTRAGEEWPDPSVLGDAMRAQVERDTADAEIARRVAEQAAQDAKDSRDPAVGLDRAARVRIARQNAMDQDRATALGLTPQGQTDERAQLDADRGVAPGTSDFEATQPKGDPGRGKRPWWTMLGGPGDYNAQTAPGDDNAQTDQPRSAVGKIGAALGGFARATDTRRNVMVSDARAKEAAFESGKREGKSEVLDDVLAPLSGDEPSFIANKSPAVRAAYANFMPPTGKVINFVSEMRGKPAAAPEAPRQMPPRREEKADPNARSMFDRDAQYLSAGGAASGKGAGGSIFDRDEQYMTSRDPVAGANRAMAGSAYAYKPGFTPPDQEPGEPNFGPMAQRMERNPITATAVKTDPSTGLKVIDKDKALKVTMSGLADLQDQQDETNRMLSLIARGNHAMTLVPGRRR